LQLLPLLLYDDTMMVQCVLNGVGAVSSDEWNISDILERKARLTEVAV
jgi:hypothetical protein